jgi:hypothetical protein
MHVAKGQRRHEVKSAIKLFSAHERRGGFFKEYILLLCQPRMPHESLIISLRRIGHGTILVPSEQSAIVRLVPITT